MSGHNAIRIRVWQGSSFRIQNDAGQRHVEAQDVPTVVLYCEKAVQQPKRSSTSTPTSRCSVGLQERVDHYREGRARLDRKAVSENDALAGAEGHVASRGDDLKAACRR